MGNCTWYANGRLRELGYNANQLNHLTGNAANWATQAAAAGIAVDQTATVGSIAQLDSSSSFTLGHVGVVESVNADDAGGFTVVTTPHTAKQRNKDDSRASLESPRVSNGGQREHDDAEVA